MNTAGNGVHSWNCRESKGYTQDGCKYEGRRLAQEVPSGAQDTLCDGDLWETYTQFLPNETLEGAFERCQGILS